MANELDNKPLFKGAIEEPQPEPLLPQPILPLFQGTGDEQKPEPLNPEPMRPFLVGGNEQLVNYDYFDVARQTGYKIYNIFQENQQIASYSLFDDGMITSITQNVVGRIYAAGVTSGAAFIVADLKFNTPQNIRGDLYMNVLCEYKGQGVITLSGAVFHYDGTTETLLGRSYDRSPLLLVTTSGANIVKIDVPSKHFKAGETLRIKQNLELSGAGTQTSGAIYFNSNNKIFVPFRI